MKPGALHNPASTVPKCTIPARSYALALVLSAIFWLLAWYGDTVLSMISTWQHSETFTHGFLVVPISAYLVWRRRHAIHAHCLRPNFWMLLPLGMAGFAWLLGHLATVVVVQQYSLVVMMLFLIASVAGNRIVKVLAFPLFFLLFAVPFGDIFLPAMMNYTADFTVFALRLTGIPVYREGLYFTVPSGNWSVVEACSGLRYLIASVTLGVLYAYLTYTQLRRRVIFVLLSIIAPIVANWLRAYMIVMIGHLTSMKHAVGVDHLIYGWLFFGVVMFLLYWIGSFWREDQVTVTGAPDAPVAGVSISPSMWKPILAAAVASSGVVAAAPAIASYLQGALQEVPVVQAPPEFANWPLASGPLSEWKPQFVNPSARIGQVYGSGNGRVELLINYYRNQRPGAQLISSHNALVHPTDKSWANTGADRRLVDVGSEKIALIESRLRGRDTHLLVWHWYWIDGQYTSNAYWGKLLQAKSKLLGRGDNAAAIIVATTYELSPAEGVDRLQDFVKTMLPAVAKALHSTR